MLKKMWVFGASVLMSLVISGPALAAEKVSGPVKGVATLSVYAKPVDSEAPRSVDVGTVGFPLTVLAKKGDFLKVRLGQREVWLDANEVNLDQAVSFECHKSDAPPKPVGSTKGAIGGCK